MKVKVKHEVEAKYLDLTVAVRYGEEDMPFDAPLRVGDLWQARIDLDTGTIVDWPKGQTLAFDDMKVCDEGVYILLDESEQEIARIEGYVPNDLLPGDYGDYLSLTIDETGKITNWERHPSLSNFETDAD